MMIKPCTIGGAGEIGRPQMGQHDASDTLLPFVNVALKFNVMLY